MILLLSPAKSQDFQTPASTKAYSQPVHLKEAGRLMKILKTLSMDEVGRLMGISENLAALNAGRFQQWRTPFTPENAKQAVLAFDGDVYEGLQAGTFTEEDLAFAQDHLRILSGLYGLLRPLDLIQPYRLEMGIPLANAKGKDLYAFWRDTLTRTLGRDLEENADEKPPTLVNLASLEYSKALDLKALGCRVVAPAFQSWSRGAYRVVSFHAKRARGLMARFAIRNRITRPSGLLDFDEEGYRFDPQASGEDQWVFRQRP
jgi:cytoplasmic iron level regulating protein YaaA (DUF328/UPF0246 family)